MHCLRCGHQLLAAARFCPECGAAVTAQNPPAPVSPARKSSKALLWAGGIGCFALVGLGVLGALVGPALLARAGYELELPFGEEAATGAITGVELLREGRRGAPPSIGAAPASGAASVVLSPDQELVKATFGRPPAFRVAFGADPLSGKPARVETWLYPRQAASFVFREGKYADSTDIPREGAPLKPDTARPEHFVPALTLADLAGRHGEPVFQLDLPGAEGLMTAFHFASGLVAGFEQKSGKLCFVEQLARRSP